MTSSRLRATITTASSLPYRESGTRCGTTRYLATPPQGLFLFQAGGAIEFVTLDSGPSLFEQPAAAPWFPLPGYPVGCLVWFNTTTGEKGRVTFPLRLTVPGHYAAGGECVWDRAAASAGDGVGFSVGVCGGVYDGGLRGFGVGRKRRVGRSPTLFTVPLRNDRSSRPSAIKATVTPASIPCLAQSGTATVQKSRRFKCVRAAGRLPSISNCKPKSKRPDGLFPSAQLKSCAGEQ